MKVVAVKLAFYNGARVRPGAVMDIPDGLKGSWFAPVDKAPKPAGKREARALSEMGKPAAASFIEVNEAVE